MYVHACMYVLDVCGCLYWDVILLVLILIPRLLGAAFVCLGSACPSGHKTNVIILV